MTDPIISIAGCPCSICPLSDCCTEQQYCITCNLLAKWTLGHKISEGDWDKLLGKDKPRKYDRYTPERGRPKTIGSTSWVKQSIPSPTTDEGTAGGEALMKYNRDLGKLKRAKKLGY
jgi:hypothetical protein